MANKSKASAIKPVKAWAIIRPDDIFARHFARTKEIAWKRAFAGYGAKDLQAKGYRCIRVTITPE